MPITEVEKIWMDGELVDWHDAQVHVLSHALHYGSGVFEGIRAYETVRGPAVWHLDEHLRRLYRSAKLYHLEIPFSPEALTEGTKDLIRANELSSCYIRPLAFRGYGEMGVNPLEAPVNVTIAVWPWGAYLGEDALERGVRVKVSSLAPQPAELPARRRQGYRAVHQQRARQGREPEGRLRRGDHAERARLHHRRLRREHLHRAQGRLAHAAHDRRARSTASRGRPSCGLARELGYEVREENLVRTDLYNAEECFFTGTAAELTPIREVDDREVGRAIGAGSRRSCSRRSSRRRRARTPRHQDWLTYAHD